MNPETNNISGEKRKISDISISQENNMSIPITLEKCVSLLDKRVLLEYLPKERIKALLKSDKLALEWGKSSYIQRYAEQNHLNEIKQLKAYLQKYNDKYSAVLCKYVKPKHGWGRVHPQKSLGLTSLGRGVRNTLIKDLYYDFDLKNAQVEIIRNICQRNHIQCLMLNDYCTKREDILKEIVDTYLVDRKSAKKLILRLCFFGTFDGWCREQNKSGEVKNTWITNFVRELHDIATHLKEKNISLYESARKSKEAKNKTKNVIGSFFALYLQEWELRLVEKIISWMMSNTDIMNHPNGKTQYHVGVYEYDGIKLLKENVDKYDGGKEALRLDIIRKTMELTGFDLEWVEKPIEKFHDIASELELVKEDEKEDNDLKSLCDKIRSRFDDTGVIETIQEILPNHYLYCHEQWYGWTGEKWMANQRPLELAIMYQLPKHWKKQLQPFTEKYPEPEGEDRNASQKLLYGVPSKVGHVDGIIGELEKFEKHHIRSNRNIGGCVGRGRIILANDDIEFDKNPDLLGFNNGVFDINEECFRPARFDDYVTWSCGWDFHPMLRGINYMKNGVLCQVTEDPNGEDLIRLDEIKKNFRQIF